MSMTKTTKPVIENLKKLFFMGEKKYIKSVYILYNIDFLYKWKYILYCYRFYNWHKIESVIYNIEIETPLHFQRKKIQETQDIYTLNKWYADHDHGNEW